MELTPEERQKIYEEERAKHLATQKSWLKLLSLIALVALLAYGAVLIFTKKGQQASQPQPVQSFQPPSIQSSPVISETLAAVLKSASPPSFSLDLEGQLNRIRSEGSDLELIKNNIQQADIKITYALLKKNSEKYAGQPWAFTGTVYQIFERGNRTQAFVALDGWGSKNIEVVGDFQTDFVEKNKVYVVGYLAGDYSYKSVAGWDLTIPALAARAMLKPADAAKYRRSK